MQTDVSPVRRNESQHFIRVQLHITRTVGMNVIQLCCIMQTIQHRLISQGKSGGVPWCIKLGVIG